MSENLRDNTLAWLDSIGADGLMHLPSERSWDKEDIDWALTRALSPHNLVPAYRHADGTYHTEKEAATSRGVKPEQIVVGE